MGNTAQVAQDHKGSNDRDEKKMWMNHNGRVRSRQELLGRKGGTRFCSPAEVRNMPEGTSMASKGGVRDLCHGLCAHTAQDIKIYTIVWGRTRCIQEPSAAMLIIRFSIDHLSSAQITKSS
eukprot:764058-Hanusia_phi.AAC.6